MRSGREAASVESEATIAKGCERILYVDDEAAIADVSRKTLERLGYKVVSETGSQEALEMFKVSPERFDLVITDHAMPKMTGVDLAKEINRIRPDIPIVICTGLNEIPILDALKPFGVRSVLLKPFDVRMFAKVVRGVLDEGKSA
jgi:CheY-like chemotaxis protein